MPSTPPRRSAAPLGHAVHPRSAFRTLPLVPLRSARPRRVLVLGAGLAGLSAALQLARAGHEVEVLEARDRTGGRVHTLRSPFRDGQHVELGAMFVPGHHNLTVGYAVEFGLPLTPIPPDLEKVLYYVDGRRVENPDDPAAWPHPPRELSRLGGLRAMFAAFAAPPEVIAELGDPRAPGWPPEPLRRYDDLSMRDFMASRGASDEAIEVLRLGYLDEWGDGIDSCSALFILRDHTLLADPFPPRFRAPHLHPGAHPAAAEPPADAMYTFAGGTESLVRAFAGSAELAGRIRLGRAVRRVETDASGVRVVCEAGGSEERYDAERAICTLPFSVLRECELPAALSEGKRRAIRELRYTPVVRNYVQAGSRVWNQDAGTGIAYTDLPIMLVSETTLTQPGTSGILEAVPTGPRARGLGGLTAQARERAVLKQLETLFPGVSARVVATACKDWITDPWARGGYCWFAPGEMFGLLPHVAGAEGRLHFAGDHTSALPGWMEGALESGLRAAEEVARAD